MTLCSSPTSLLILTLTYSNSLHWNSNPIYLTSPDWTLYAKLSVETFVILWLSQITWMRLIWPRNKKLRVTGVSSMRGRWRSTRKKRRRRKRSLAMETFRSTRVRSMPGRSLQWGSSERSSIPSKNNQIYSHRQLHRSLNTKTVPKRPRKSSLCSLLESIQESPTLPIWCRE